MTSRIVTASGRGVLRLVNHAQGTLSRESKNGSTKYFNQARNTVCSRGVHFSASPGLNGSSVCCQTPTAQHKRKDTFLICNHHLKGFHSSSDRDLNISCGHCNVLGNYDLQSKCNIGSSSINSISIQHNALAKYSPLLATNHVDTNWLILRSFHSSPRAFKDESKAEQTIKVLKDEAKIKSSIEEPVLIKDPVTKKVAAETAESTSTTVATPAPVKKSIRERVVAELKHYYHGFRLLFVDVKICIRSVWQVLNGKSLTRRERRQLVRTTADLFRLVPFSVFIIVPFMEFLLPVALKLFPGMLPSTFAEEKKEQEKIRKQLKMKLEMAKFLQDTIEETALTRKGAKGENAQEFVDFMDRIRSAGTEVSNQEILKYSKLFDEELTLDTLSYGQLRALLRLLDMPAVGTSNFLRFKLRMKLRHLKTDDRAISKEGLEKMTVTEMQEACRARGMRALGVPKERMSHQLEQWLDLHLVQNIPTSLLLMSRALYLPEKLSTEEQLKATISALPDATAEGAKVKISEVTGDRVDHKTKIEIIRQEEEAIKKEAEEEAKKAAEETRKAEEEEAKRLEEETLVDRAEVMTDGTPDILKSSAQPVSTPSIVDSAPATSAATAANDTVAAEPEKEPEISKTDLEEMEDVLEKVAEEKDVDLDKEELEALKEDVSEYKEAIEDLREVVLSSLGGQAELQESKSAKRLSKRVNKMVAQMDGIMSGLNEEKDQLMEDIEIKEVRIKRSMELRDNEGLRQDIIDQITSERKNLVSINELLLSMRRIQKVPDDTKYQRIAQVLDEDSDGVIDINDALKVIELLGRENVSIQAEQMTEIMDMLQKEAVQDQEDKDQKQREKLEKIAQQEQEQQQKQEEDKQKQ